MVLRGRGRDRGLSLGFDLGERRDGWTTKIPVLWKICHRDFPLDFFFPSFFWLVLLL